MKQSHILYIASEARLSQVSVIANGTKQSHILVIASEAKQSSAAANGVNQYQVCVIASEVKRYHLCVIASLRGSLMKRNAFPSKIAALRSQ